MKPYQVTAWAIVDKDGNCLKTRKPFGVHVYATRAKAREYQTLFFGRPGTEHFTPTQVAKVTATITEAR